MGEGPSFAVDHLPPRVIPERIAGTAGTQHFHEAVNHYRRSLVVEALAHAHGNRAAAAKALGLHRTHLLKLMKALGVN
jgi:DNA-binding NtrC family response regulator